MQHKITLIPGDGIGYEVSLAATRCIEACGVGIQWDKALAGQDALEKTGELLPQSALDSIKKNKVALKGPLTTPIATGFRSVNVAIRQALDLFACVRPAKSYPGVKSRFKDIDLVIIRENSEDLYAGIEFQEGKPETQSLIAQIQKSTNKSIRYDSGISIKPISKFASERIVRFAFQYALENKRKKITCVHKANIMKFTDGLFLEVARRVAGEFAGRIIFEEAIVDNMAMQLVQKPHNYDVLVLPNLYGDIISDLCAGLIGGLGVAPGANIGAQMAVFEAVHGSAPKYQGKNKANPCAMILSGVLMLRHIQENKAADNLEEAVRQVIAEGKSVTYDLKPDPLDPSAVGTAQMADAIINKLKKI
ncbi:MAG: isocitrate/isopropylmalate dehydrogenase family protein [Candidatus Omnitrophica bacterium]|nr:isocitrate/isopropylmalate dehydrogenase family protein [Candidatus Omnitrophota bacterium]MBU4303899.1 isocitrate/isopropylmalate dehydrogenase family protein [Candidatus Omnitrophota bacterium]MBU4468076.1 isocitrate/isopropylmalate dehydrogenase family protein [Candidatus Omnitrophota bacterium]MCG2707851.1 isocitrate/isopropylmalate dehydrogenase family protein [Candidatus Omnitrophota bacterium]